jgi:hypothetical protein
MLSQIDRLLIQRCEETMRAFTRGDFRERRGGARPTKHTCPVNGCKRRTRAHNKCCKKHWRHQHRFSPHSIRG